MLLFLCFQEPPVARNIEVHAVVMENLTYLHRYLTITVNKKQMQELQTVCPTLRHSRLLGRAGKYFFFLSVKILKLPFLIPNGTRVFLIPSRTKVLRGREISGIKIVSINFLNLKKIILGDVLCFTLLHSKYFASI